MKIRILIIDDEAIICMGMKSMIETLNMLEISEISLAQNKKEAMKIVSEQKPEIIISDICLGDGNGLDLIREIEAVCSKSRFIVLSGYDNFEYAKEAIKLGVMDYLLKPASMEELEGVLNSAIESLKKQRMLENGTSSTYRKLIVENSLNKIFLSGQLTEENINTMLDEHQIAFQHPFFCVGVVAFDASIYLGKESEDAEVLITKAGEGLLAAEGISVVCFNNVNRDLVLLFNCPERMNKDCLHRFMLLFSQSLMQVARGGFISAISDVGSGVGSVHMLYRHCKEALAYKILYQLYDVISCQDISSKSNKLISYDSEMNELARYMNSYRGDAREISDYIDRLINKDALANYSIESIRLLYQQIMQIIGIAAVDDKLIQNNNAYRDFSSFTTLSELRIYLKETVYNINELMKTVQKERTIVDIAKRYVKENFRKDINLTVVANMVSMNYSYFSKLFKNQTGMNFSDYVMKIRMEEAKKLLADPMNKIYEISIRVGYENPKNFTRAFKSHLGITPSEYQMKGS